jgi:hypothetical protein
VHIEALIAYVSHQQSQQRLIRRWQRQILAINGAELNPQQPSKSAIDWLPHLQQAFYGDSNVGNYLLANIFSLWG